MSRAGRVYPQDIASVADRITVKFDVIDVKDARRLDTGIVGWAHEHGHWWAFGTIQLSKRKRLISCDLDNLAAADTRHGKCGPGPDRPEPWRVFRIDAHGFCKWPFDAHIKRAAVDHKSLGRNIREVWARRIAGREKHEADKVSHASTLERVG